MKKSVALGCLPLLLAAEVHMAKLEPYETYRFKAAEAGQVVLADDEMEGKIAGDDAIVQIDDKVDKAQLKALKTAIESVKKTLELTKEMAENQQKVYERDRRYYARVKNLKTKSQTEKDRVFATMAAAKNQLLTLKEKIASLENQIADTDYRIAMLKDRIAKKRVAAPGLYIYKVAVRRDDYVNPGTLLMTAMDIRKGRLVLYLDRDEMRDLAHKKIYIDGKPTDLRWDKVIRVADDKHITSYRAEIVVPNPGKLFSKLLKVEIK